MLNIVRQKWHLNHKFNFLPIQRKDLILISNLIFELSKILLNNIYSPKQKLHFYLLNLYFNFHLSTKHKLYFVFAYKNCFSSQPIKPLTSFSLLGFLLTFYTLSKLSYDIDWISSDHKNESHKFCLSFHMCVKFLTTKNLLCKVLLDLILVLRELVTLGVLQPFPLKRMSSWDSKQ